MSSNATTPAPSSAVEVEYEKRLAAYKEGWEQSGLVAPLQPEEAQKWARRLCRLHRAYTAAVAACRKKSPDFEFDEDVTGRFARVWELCVKNGANWNWVPSAWVEEHERRLAEEQAQQQEGLRNAVEMARRVQAQKRAAEAQAKEERFAQEAEERRREAEAREEARRKEEEAREVELRREMAEQEEEERLRREAEEREVVELQEKLAAEMQEKLAAAASNPAIDFMEVDFDDDVSSPARPNEEDVATEGGEPEVTNGDGADAPNAKGKKKRTASDVEFERVFVGLSAGDFGGVAAGDDEDSTDEESVDKGPVIAPPVARGVLRQRVACEWCVSHKIDCIVDGDGPCKACSKRKKGCSENPKKRERRGRSESAAPGPSKRKGGAETVADEGRPKKKAKTAAAAKKAKKTKADGMRVEAHTLLVKFRRASRQVRLWQAQAEVYLEDLHALEQDLAEEDGYYTDETESDSDLELA